MGFVYGFSMLCVFAFVVCGWDLILNVGLLINLIINRVIRLELYEFIKGSCVRVNFN